MTDPNQTTSNPIEIHPHDFDAIVRGVFCERDLTPAVIEANELWGRLLRGIDGGLAPMTNLKHPLAFCPGTTGANGMQSGCRIIHADGRRGVADEFLRDGEALVTWSDGTHDEVKWHLICKDFSV
jgi:hypothetical protein